MYIKENLFKILSISLFTIFFSICCFVTYLIIKKEQNPIYKLDSYISYLNNTYEKLDDNIDSIENIEKLLEEINILKQSKKNINTAMTLEQVKNFDHLINSSELYIKQILNIKNNNNNINQSLVSLKNYFDDIVSSLKSLPANSNLLNEIIDTISLVQDTYENNFYSEKINSISNINLNNFINQLNSIMYEFLPIIEDINPKLEKARNGQYDYKIILNTLDRDMEICKNLKLSLSKLPIPQNGLELYHQLEEILDIYYEYNLKLKYAIKNEDLSEKHELTEDSLNKMYDQINQLYSKILNNYNTLKHKIDSKLTISTSIYN